MQKLEGIYAITDPGLMGDDFLDMAQQVINSGVQVLQYRNKAASFDRQLLEAKHLCQLCQDNNVVFLVNDHLDLAIQVDADGVHLGQGDTPLETAREKLGSDKIIGITCHDSLKLATEAENQGADYIAFGRFYPSQTKPGASPAMPGIISQAKQLLNIPVAAIGGITPQNVAPLLEQGADMIAVIHGIFGQADPGQAVSEYQAVFSKFNTN